MRITAQFINAEDGTHFWSKNYDRDLDDIFAIQDEISLLIADEIRENFGHFEISESFAHSQPHPINAYDWYLKGMHFLKRKDFEDIKEAISCFEKAVEIDENYADAHACIGESYIHYMAFSEMDAEQAFAKINESINKALKINPKQPRAHKVDAYMKLFYWDWEGTKNAYEKAIDYGLPPENEFISYYHIFIKNEKKYAIELAKNLLLTDPLHAFSHWQLGACYYFDKQFEKALELFDYALELNPAFGEALRWKGLVLGYLGRFEEALDFIHRALQVNKGQVLARLDLMTVKILMGKRDEVIAELENTEFLDVCDPAQIYALLNMPEKAIPLLQQGFEQHNIMLISLKHFFVWDNLRGIEDFENIIKNLNYPDTSITPSKASSSSKSLLTVNEITIFSTKLEQLMQEEQVYLDEALNLRLLADNIDLNSNKLSWLLNAHYGKNFNEFVNQYRLETFKQKALNPENNNLTLLALAYDSGFNSKTVFNTYFKKVEGVTPKAWLRGKV